MLPRDYEEPQVFLREGEQAVVIRSPLKLLRKSHAELVVGDGSPIPPDNLCPITGIVFLPNDAEVVLEE